MNWEKIARYLLWLCILAVLLLWWWRFWHFVVQDIALGYDPGRYRANFAAYIDLLPYFNFGLLEDWIQRVFPPYVGMMSAITSLITWLSLDRSVTRWVAGQSLLVSVWLYVALSSIDKRVALVAAGLSWISFVQYQVFWRNYIKQLWGMFFLLITVWLLIRRKYVVAIPIIAALAVTHRPALLMLVALCSGWVLLQWVDWLRSKLWDQRITGIDTAWLFSLIWASVVAAVLALGAYGDLFAIQILPLFGRFFSALDTLGVPVINDSFKAGGTFMTTIDFFKTNWIILLASIWGYIVSFKDRRYRWIHIGYVFSLLWIFGQLTFYQRMMGYGDLFFLALTAVLLVRVLTRRRQRGWIVMVGAFVIHGAIYAYRVHRSWRPIIETQEFEFIQTLPDILPEDATVMSTHSIYSLRLNGRSERPTIAPGLFGIDRRNKSDRKTYRESDGALKCEMLQETYGDSITKLYIRQWSKQQVDDVTGGECFSVYRASKTRLPWRMYEVVLK